MSTEINISPSALGYTRGLFSQTTSSTPVAATTTEGSLIGTGVGGMIVPANGFKVGDSFHAKLGGKISCANSEALEIRVKSGSALLADTGVMTLNATSGDFWEIEIDFTVRAIGAAGVASIHANGQFVYIRNSTLVYSGAGFDNQNNTTFDTTINNQLEITAQWGSNNAANTISSDIFTLIKTF